MTTEKLQAMKEQNIKELTKNIDTSTPTGEVLKNNLTK
jgi:hypothetical protein